MIHLRLRLLICCMLHKSLLVTMIRSLAEAGFCTQSLSLLSVAVHLVAPGHFHVRGWPLVTPDILFLPFSQMHAGMLNVNMILKLSLLLVSKTELLWFGTASRLPLSHLMSSAI